MSPVPRHLTESQPAELALDIAETVELAALGRRLAGRREWWGASADTSDHASAIAVTPAAQGNWRVRVNDAVGVICVGGRSIPVLPKIPVPHLLELLRLGQAIPRTHDEGASMAEGESLFDLVARWFIAAVEAVVRRDLIRDYETRTEDLNHIRGRIDLLPSTKAVLQGRATLRCEFDELDADNPLNRVLLAALDLVARFPGSSEQVKRQALRLKYRFEDVSSMRTTDLETQLTPRTWYYTNAFSLARTLISGSARNLDTGDAQAWAFLIRTPETVEAGIRELLRIGLAGKHAVTKRGLTLYPSPKTLNPDLVFDDGGAVGDVKYKLQGPDWNTGDLYQAVAFGSGFRSKHALIITFAQNRPSLGHLHVGDTVVTNICWRADATTSPERARAMLVRDVREWLVGTSAGAGGASTCACPSSSV